jgi:hypothetical protein
MVGFHMHCIGIFLQCCSQRALEALHPNIVVMRHPDHIGAVGAINYPYAYPSYVADEGNVCRCC